MAAVLSPGGKGGGQTDRHPLLMEQPLNRSIAEHVIDIGREGIASVSVRHRGNLDASVAPQAPVMTSSSSSPTASNSRNVLFTRTGDNYSRRRSPLNSGLWISIELVVNLSQITAAIISLSLSRHDHPKAPLFAWVVGYTVGCFATLPHLYWRYAHRYQGLEQDAPQLHQNSSQNNTPESTSYTAIVVNQALEERTNSTPLGSRFEQSLANSSPRVHAFVDHFKMALDCFFAVWFVVGNVWVFGGNSSAADAPHLYRLCIVFLTFSCIGYAMPFILCAMICCCLPCIISFLGFREDMSQNRGATSEEINALPTYKFKLKKSENGEIIDPESQSAGGILAIGTDKERTICAEDAECCICLAKYADDDQIRELPCAHFFHTECVDKWLKINALCPLCKYEVGNNASSVSNDNPDPHQNDMRVENGSDQSSTGSIVPFVAAL